MAQFNTSSGSVPDASYKYSLRQKQCALSCVAEKIAAFEGNLSGVFNTTSSTHAHMRTHVGMKSAVKTNTDISHKNSVTLASTMARPIYCNRKEITVMLKPETRESDVPSFPKVRQSTKQSLAQQDMLTKEQRLIKGNVRVEYTISSKLPKLYEMQKPNYISTRGPRNKLQIGSVDPSVTKTVLVLGSPPTKPKRPPSVDIHRFRRNLKCLNKGPGMKMPPSAVPSHLHPSPSFNHAAALSQQLDMDESYENVGIKKPPPLPLQEHPSKRTESPQVDLSDGRMEQAEKSKKHQKSKHGKDDANHGKVTKKKEAEPKGTINPKEIKHHERKAKKEKKEKKKKFKIKGPIHTVKKGKALDCKGAKSDLSLNQAEITEVVQNTDVSVMTEAVTTGLDDLNVNEETRMYWSEADVYDDIGALDVCRYKMPLKYCLNIFNGKNQSHIVSLADFTDSLLFSWFSTQMRRLFALL
ncbi:uncharacterized protein LOC125890334 isoform X2 [Epinephelus fuscoguttatus]|uniref:uncharacterized protein LOC125890334 isoform X2 n=1 Tax=Epinephelus fuscoguttatus TaxID=293821 RepID=UPI0020D13815|nr:uncharacterized protein LOC125890334 isoform X2 [Epinephelus fuscoguttatus]